MAFVSREHTHTHAHSAHSAAGEGEKMSNGGISEVNIEEISQDLCLSHFVEGCKIILAMFARGLER